MAGQVSQLILSLTQISFGRLTKVSIGGQVGNFAYKAGYFGEFSLETLPCIPLSHRQKLLYSSD